MSGIRFWMYQTIATRDGESCASCKKTGSELLIDHVDTNRQNNLPSNLRLLCRSCNARHYTVQHSKVSERERENISIEGSDESEMPATVKIALDKQPVYVAWLYENVSRPGGLSMWQAIYEGSDVCDISPLTARRYLYKKLATIFELGSGNRGHKLIKERAGQTG